LSICEPGTMYAMLYPFYFWRGASLKMREALGRCHSGRSLGVERVKAQWPLWLVPINCEDNTVVFLNKHSDFQYKRPIKHSNDAVEHCAHSLLVPLFPSLLHRQMLSLFSVLAFLFIISGIAAAGPAIAPRGYDDHDKCYGDIYAPECLDPTDPLVSWVCTVSLPCILWPLSDPLSVLQQLRPRPVLGRSVPVVDLRQVL
jgi:hypothetical protein